MKKVQLNSSMVKDFSSNNTKDFDLLSYIQMVMENEGYPTSNCCTKLTLLERNFANDTAAKTAGLVQGQIYHTAGALKVIL